LVTCRIRKYLNAMVNFMADCLAHAVSHKWLDKEPLYLRQNHWTRYGTEGFLGHGYMPGAVRNAVLISLDPDGCLVRNREWLRNHKINEKTGAQT
jgi:hypothetical protein